MRVAAAPEEAGLAGGPGRELPNGFVGKRAAAGGQADTARQMDRSRHDYDLASGPRIDQPWAVGADEPCGLVLDVPIDLDHVLNGYAFRDAGDQWYPSVGGLGDGVWSEGRWDKDQRHIGLGVRHSFFHGVEDRHFVFEHR